MKLMRIFLTLSLLIGINSWAEDEYGKGYSGEGYYVLENQDNLTLYQVDQDNPLGKNLYTAYLLGTTKGGEIRIKEEIFTVSKCPASMLNVGVDCVTFKYSKVGKTGYWSTNLTHGWRNDYTLVEYLDGGNKIVIDASWKKQ